jgi:hypothetical protein
MRRFLFLLALAVGIGFVVSRARRAALAPEPDRDPWTTEPPVALRGQDDPWMTPVAGECPPTHPVKAKMSSGIYHLPGMAAYGRTNPDRCYLDAAAAEADGLRPAKR